MRGGSVQPLLDRLDVPALGTAEGHELRVVSEAGNGAHAPHRGTTNGAGAFGMIFRLHGAYLIAASHRKAIRECYGGGRVRPAVSV